jgi:hypothetical protein
MPILIGQAPVKMVAYSSLCAFIATTTSFVLAEHNWVSKFSFPERHWKEWDTILSVDRPDPFKRRMEELKERGLPGAVGGKAAEE